MGIVEAREWTRSRERRCRYRCSFLAAWFGVWLGRHQQRLIEYQKEEIRTLRGRLGSRRQRLTDAERRRLAVLGKDLGRKALAEIATLATPHTILRWYRDLFARKYDGSSTNRGPAGRARGRSSSSRVLEIMSIP